MPVDSPLLRDLGGVIAGRIVAPEGPRFPVRDPATGEVLATLPSLGAREATAAVEAAAAAVGALAIARRAEVLRAIGAALRAHRDALGRIITLENGKPLAEAVGEVDYAAGFYEDAAQRLHLLDPQPVPGRPRGLAWVVHRRPAGVAGLITPWNFPLAMLAKKLSAALAAGCSAVVKPAEKTPLTAIAFFSLLRRLDLPDGLVNLVFGDAPAIGEVLCAHPAVRVLSFTGSTAVGQRLAAQCAPHLKRVALELGGNAPFVVFEDADLDLAADALVANKLRASGQTCVCTNRVLVHEAVAEALCERLVARVARLRVGPGLDPEVDVGPLIDEAAADKVRALIDDALAHGARRLAGGPGRGPFLPPTVLLGLSPEMACAREEIFGPVFAVGTFADEAEAVGRADDTRYGLAAYVFTADPARAARVAAALRFGHVGVNTSTGPTPEAPFGGMRHSGLGREGGDEGILEYVEPQVIVAP